MMIVGQPERGRGRGWGCCGRGGAPRGARGVRRWRSSGCRTCRGPCCRTCPPRGHNPPPSIDPPPLRRTRCPAPTSCASPSSHPGMLGIMRREGRGGARETHHLVRLVVDNALAADLPVRDEERPADTSQHVSVRAGGAVVISPRTPGTRAWVSGEGAGREAYWGGGSLTGGGLTCSGGRPARGGYRPCRT